MNYIISFLIFMFSVLSLAGGHVGNGGDIRRFRAHSAIREFKYNIIEFNKNASNPKNLMHMTLISSELIKNRLILADWVKYTYMYADKNETNECLTAVGGISQMRPFIFSLNYFYCEKNKDRSFYLNKMGQLYLKEILNSQVHNLDFESILEFNKACGSLVFESKMPSHLDYDLGLVKSDKEFMSHIENGRKLAIELVGKYDPSTLPDGNGADVNGYKAKKLILTKAKELLPIELKKSVFYVNTEVTSSCGLTGLKSLSPVYFSMKECLGIKNDFEMAWVIIHEMVHHTGIESENYADFVANSILDFGR